MRITLLHSALFILIIGMLSTSCVAKKYLTAAEQKGQRLQEDSGQMARKIMALEKNLASMQGNYTDAEKKRMALQAQLEATRSEAQSRLQDASSQLQDASSKLQDASSRLNMSQQQIEDQQRRLAQLQDLIDQQRKNTLELRKKINDALVNFNSDELTVSTRDGKVYVSLQENLLFPSGSAAVNPKGKLALGKLAEVLNANPEINVEIEGHTDSIPMKGRYEDNWALSVARSTSIVRILTDNYRVDPIRVTASGRSKYEPVDTNLTNQGRAKNRRTEIILEPKLDELMRLIQSDEPAQ